MKYLDYVKQYALIEQVEIKDNITNFRIKKNYPKKAQKAKTLQNINDFVKGGPYNL